VDQCALVGIIIQHYPSALGIALRGRAPRTTNELLLVLNEFDESTSFCDTPPNRQTPNQSTPNQQPHRSNNPNGYNHRVSNRQPQQVQQVQVAVQMPIQQLDTSGNEPGPSQWVQH